MYMSTPSLSHTLTQMTESLAGFPAHEVSERAIFGLLLTLNKYIRVHVYRVSRTSIPSSVDVRINAAYSVIIDKLISGINWVSPTNKAALATELECYTRPNRPNWPLTPENEMRMVHVKMLLRV